MKKNICLVGVGPHCIRIYLKCFKQLRVAPKLIIEVESKKEETINCLKKFGFKNYVVYCINDKYKDAKFLTKKDNLALGALCDNLSIDHAVICTEPKAHNAYLNFFIDHKINVISDKPITVSKNMMKLKNINSIRDDFFRILKKAQQNRVNCQIMCQRAMHNGYNYVKDLIKNIVSCYNMPITFIEVFHSDGKWMMPHDLENEENHPYKYGYGKLFHSGYHFVQLLSEFLEINNCLSDENKHLYSCDSYSTFFTPNDELATFGLKDYSKLFSKQGVPNFYKQKQVSFKNYGEKNTYSLFSFKNKNNDTITVAELNLLQNSFSRRGWIKTKEDEYKGNGRIRHEYVNIEIGTLMNVKVHSYQSKEIKDRTDMEFENGGLEHFDIDIYRNVDLIGGVPYQRIQLKDLYDTNENNNMGYNEKARLDFIANFLNDSGDVCEISQHKLGICLLHKLCLSFRDYNLFGKTHSQRFKIGDK